MRIFGPMLFVATLIGIVLLFRYGILKELPSEWL